MAAHGVHNANKEPDTLKRISCTEASNTNISSPAHSNITAQSEEPTKASSIEVLTKAHITPAPIENRREQVASPAQDCSTANPTETAVFWITDPQIMAR